MSMYPHTIHVRVTTRQKKALSRAARRQETHPSVLLRGYVQTLVEQETRKK